MLQQFIDTREWFIEEASVSKYIPIICEINALECPICSMGRKINYNMDLLPTCETFLCIITPPLCVVSRIGAISVCVTHSIPSYEPLRIGRLCVGGIRQYHILE